MSRIQTAPQPPPMELEPYRDPCVPSPCGANAQCQSTGGQASCSCLPMYQGAPPNCRPECSINSDCAPSLACINERCRDPCPGSCGLAAHCNVVNHTPICTCSRDYIGDAFVRCYMKPPEPQRMSCTFSCNEILSVIYNNF